MEVMKNVAVEWRKKQREHDFSYLYLGLWNTKDFDTAFSVFSIQVKENIESIMGVDSQSNMYLNFDITLEEVSDALNKAKLRKAMVVEEIPNEVFKSPYLRHMLFVLF